MCGICGYIGDFDISLEVLKKMNDTMYHRGPNDSGEEIYSMQGNKYIGLAQRRLSIMDLSMLGHQPMHSNDGRITVVFNGEIYNFKEIREQITTYSFKSQCDTEVIIAAYLEWGIDCINKFNGMFAFALYDRRDESLFLVRDRIGKKPLYYYRNGNDFVFASECKPILHYPYFVKKINLNVLPFFFCNQYIQAPETIFENVYKLEPGSLLHYKNKKITIKKYWDVVEKHNSLRENLMTNYEDAKANFDLLLNDAIAMRMVADVPIGTFLSGGIDSSLVTAIAQRYADSKLKTFSIGFHDNECNEAEYARSIAEYLGTEHTEYYMSEMEALSMIEDMPKYYDEPFADSSQIPTMLVSQIAKEQVTVVLTGDGADEFFCGYSVKYENVKKAQNFDCIGNWIYKAGNFPGVGNIIGKILPNKVKLVVDNRISEERTQFGVDGIKNISDFLLKHLGGKEKFDAVRFLQNDWQDEAMLIDQYTYLPSVLSKVDRASMKYSLECRSPFMDYRIMELSYQMPQSFKYDSTSRGKRIVKDIAYDYIPRKLLERKKHGFSAPIESWMKNNLKEQILQYSQISFLEKQGIFKPIETNQFVREYFYEKYPFRKADMNAFMWRYFVFQQWYNYYCCDMC
ncbi:asparagine synthase (glutamine-hydrolyzing) [Anaerovibrio slackiae]|uniref:asparagine synthase (glutamine-hydrolyzing) n=1 Tax=Anaerovibrio slackiae TaxID=2652309 RepID=UPI003F155A43